MFCAVTFLLYLMMIFCRSYNTAIVCFVLFAIGFVGTFGSAVYQFSKGRWKEGVLTLLLLAGTIIVGMISVMAFFVDKR